MKNRKILVFSLILVLMSFMTLSVNAVVNIGGNVGEVSINKCITSGQNKGAYHITYISEVATMVNYRVLTNEDILNGHIPYPPNITDEEKIKYQFNVKKYSNNCYIDVTKEDGENVEVCPTSEQISKYQIYQKFNSENYNDYVTFDLNEKTGKFTVTIKDAFNGELAIRYVKPSEEINSDSSKTLKDYSDVVLQRKGGNNNYYYKINNVSGSTNGNTKFLNLEFYIISGKCKNILLGLVGIPMPNASNYDIDNPAFDEPGVDDEYDSKYCKEVKKYVPEGMTESEINNQLNSLKQNYINECYTSKISYDTKNNLQNTIDEKLRKFKEMFTNYRSEVSNNTLTCDESHAKNKLVYFDSRTYWMMTCFEKYTAQGDKPKLVKSGDGFEYQTQYVIERTCNISQKSMVAKPSACSWDCGHICYWNESTGVKSGTDGGPNEDFDLCVQECDNGKYTQACINSCYNRVYKSDRDLSFTDKFSYGNNKKSTIERLSSCTTNHNRPGESATGGCGESYCVSDFCNDNGGYCVSWSNVYPTPCSDNPDKEYDDALKASKQELLDLIKNYENAIDTGQYSYQIADSHLVTNNGSNYIYTVNSNDNPALDVNAVESIIDSTQTTLNLGDSGNGSTIPNSITFDNSQTKKSVITVSLPLSYINKVTGEAIYRTNEESNRVFSVNSKLNTFDSTTKFNILAYEKTGRKYYTSPWSENLNVTVDCETNEVSLARTGDYNIKVQSSGVGMGDFSSNIQCYYGVYNNYYIPPDAPEICPPPPPGGDPSGIQYIYRPIDLTNMFPNRDARWNWTGTLDIRNHTSTEASKFASDTYLKYDIDPEKTIEDIQNKGYNIYDVANNSSEVDYEFVLTRENIRNIRRYNKEVKDYNGDGNNNYLDYNMKCTERNGKQICTSRFLNNKNDNTGSEENDSFITYSSERTKADRRSIVGCNNAINGNQCDD